MYTGVLDAYQRIDCLLRAFAVALREKPDALLLVVSPLVSEASESQHKQFAAKLGNFLLHRMDFASPCVRFTQLSRPR